MTAQHILALLLAGISGALARAAIDAAWAHDYSWGYWHVLLAIVVGFFSVVTLWDVERGR